MNITSTLRHLSAGQRLGALIAAGAIVCTGAVALAAAGDPPAPALSAVDSSTVSAEATTPRPTLDRLDTAGTSARSGPATRPHETPAPTPTTTTTAPTTTQPSTTGSDDPETVAPSPVISASADPEPEPDPATAGKVSQHGAGMDKPEHTDTPTTKPAWNEIALDVLAPVTPAVPAPTALGGVPTTAGPGHLASNKPGCASNCITSATITHDPKFPKLTFGLTTNVATRAYLWVSQDEPQVTPPSVAVTDWWDYANDDPASTWSVTTSALQFDTTYWVVLLVVDQYGNERWAITDYHTMDAPFADDLAADGSPCYFGCITDGFIYPGDDYSTVDLVMLTNTWIADYSFAVSTSEPGTIDGHPFLPADVPFVQEQGGVGNKAVRGHVAGLEADTLYHVVVSVTDGEGFTQYAAGQFRSAPLPPEPTDVLISFNRVKMAYDGDPGNANRGEVAFRWGFDYGPAVHGGEADMSYFGQRDTTKLSDFEAVELPNGSGRWVRVQPGTALPLLVVNAVETDWESTDSIWSTDSCIAGSGLVTDPVYNDSCDLRTTPALLQPPSLEWIETLPTCDAYGYTDWRATHRCHEFMSVLPGSDNYATFSAIVSFAVE